MYIVPETKVISIFYHCKNSIPNSLLTCGNSKSSFQASVFEVISRQRRPNDWLCKEPPYACYVTYVT
jgi:hypothetical protein